MSEPKDFLDKVKEVNDLNDKILASLDKLEESLTEHQNLVNKALDEIKGSLLPVENIHH